MTMTVAAAQAARDAAHTAWVAAGQPRDAGNPVWEAAQAAVRELAAAKAAEAAAAPKADVSAAIARQAVTRAAIVAERTAVRHVAAIAAAHGYPRCMQGWPATPVERAANAWAIATHGGIDAALAAHEVYE